MRIKMGLFEPITSRQARRVLIERKYFCTFLMVRGGEGALMIELKKAHI